MATPHADLTPLTRALAEHPGLARLTDVQRQVLAHAADGPTTVGHAVAALGLGRWEVGPAVVFLACCDLVELDGCGFHLAVRGGEIVDQVRGAVGAAAAEECC